MRPPAPAHSAAGAALAFGWRHRQGRSRHLAALSSSSTSRSTSPRASAKRRARGDARLADLARHLLAHRGKRCESATSPRSLPSRAPGRGVVRVAQRRRPRTEHRDRMTVWKPLTRMQNGISASRDLPRTRTAISTSRSVGGVAARWPTGTCSNTTRKRLVAAARAVSSLVDTLNRLPTYWDSTCTARAPCLRRSRPAPREWDVRAGESKVSSTTTRTRCAVKS